MLTSLFLIENTDAPGLAIPDSFTIFHQSKAEESLCCVLAFGHIPVAVLGDSYHAEVVSMVSTSTRPKVSKWFDTAVNFYISPHKA